MKSLLAIALTCYWANPDDETRQLVVAAAQRLPVADDNSELIAILALAAPVQNATVVLERIRWLPLEAGGHPAAMLRIGQTFAILLGIVVALAGPAAAQDSRQE